MSRNGYELSSLLTAASHAGAPVLAVVAGSGQVARYAMEAGADLLIALSAGFFRNLGAGSLASLMPYANTNDVTERLLREQILPRRGQTPVIAGVLASDPRTSVGATLRRFAALGVQGVTNWPAVGFADGTFREVLESEGQGVEAELNLLKEAQAEGLAAFGFALEPETARRFTEAGADAMILDLGLTRSLEDVIQHRDQLQEAIARLQQMIAAVRKTGRKPLILGFGGPVITPEDFEQLLRQCDLDGFAGGSVFERFPVHEVITATVRRFKSVRIRPGAQPSESRLGEMIGASRVMKEVFRLIRKVAPHDVNVCIEGETGTGKELVATLLHRYSTRSHGPFITLNCGAIPDSLLESELFGHEKGAFTGAHRQRSGKFELAHRGSLFLDEIADLSAHGQVALLRAIQQREITRVGGETAIPVDVRIVTASHQSLSQLVQAGKFRADLFYRLNHLTIRMPALRERKEDIPLLSEAILARLKVQLNRHIMAISDRFLEKLCQHAWLGNVRELEHVLRRAALLEDAAILSGNSFNPADFYPPSAEEDSMPAKDIPRKLRGGVAKSAVESSLGNKTQAAARLGVSRKTLYSLAESIIMNPGLVAFPRARRRDVAAFLLAAVVALPLIATAAEPSAKTYTFKTLDPPTDRLLADVYQPPGDEVRPVVVFIHGGALMMGGRQMTAGPGLLLRALLDAGYVVVSIGYRLAPQVKLPAIIDDVQDACEWVRTRGPELFRINPGELMVMGQSAGGYLAMMAGFRVQPRPRALVSFWGYGDIAGKWYARPDPFYREQPLVTKEEADKSGGMKLYLYCRQQGLWPKVLTGRDPEAEPRAFDAFCPVRNVTRDYPPTLLIHGTKDTDVPYELSVQMEKELAAKGVAHELVTIPDGGHGFGKNDTNVAARTYGQVVAFLNKQRGR